MTALRALAAALAVSVSLAWPAPARAHGASHQVERRGEAWAVRVTHHGGRPLAGATYQVIRPGGAEPVGAGKTGADGWVVFRPDVPGAWLVKVIEPSGHGRTVRVEVDRVAGVMPSTSTTTTTTKTKTKTKTTATDTDTTTATATATATGATTGATSDDGPRLFGVLLAAAGIVVLFLVMRRAQRRNRAGP